MPDDFLFREETCQPSFILAGAYLDQRMGVAVTKRPSLKKTSSLMNTNASKSRTSKMKTVLGVTAALVCGVLAPTLAQAQSYGTTPYRGGAYDNQGYYYDPCQRSTTQRGTGGGLAGAGIGAAIGSGIAAKGARTEGAVLGGLLGAVVGANVGKNSAACTPGRTPPPPPPPPSAYNSGYDDPAYRQGSYQGGYQGGAYQGGYDTAGRDSYYERSYERQDSYRVDNRTGQADVNGCTLAESPIYLPDGRVQKRFVRVCPDASGKYQVVD